MIGSQRRRNTHRSDHIGSGLAASPYLQEAHDPRFARTLIWTVAIGLCAFVIWAVVTPIYEVVSGNGAIRPAGLATRIEHLEGGMITSLRIEEGDTVTAGQILLELDTRDIQSELRKVSAQTGQLEEDIARFESLMALNLEADTIISHIDDSASLSAELAFRLAQITNMNAQIAVAIAERRRLVANLDAVGAEHAIAQAQVTRYQDLNAANLVPIERLEIARRALLQLVNQQTQISGEIAVQTATIEQLRANKNESVAGFRRDTAIALADHRAERTAVLETQIQLFNRIDRSTVRARVSGILNGLKVQDVGEIIAQGEVIAEIFPLSGDTFAEIEVPADRIGGVQVGDAASLKVLTYDFARYGDIAATVDRIAPSSRLKDNGDAVFVVRLAYQARGIGPDAAQLTLTPGMTVLADIRSEKRTVLYYLLKPIRVIADRAMTES